MTLAMPDFNSSKHVGKAEPKKKAISSMIPDAGLQAYLAQHIAEGRTIVFLNGDGSVSPLFQGDTLCTISSDPV